MFIKKILPPLACDFLGLFIPGKLGQNFFEDLDTINTLFANPTLLPIVSVGQNPKMGYLASKLMNPSNLTSVRKDDDHPLLNSDQWPFVIV